MHQYGKVFVDAAGNGLARTNTNEWVPVQNVLSASGHLTARVTELAGTWALLAQKLQAKLLAGNEAFVQDFLQDFGTNNKLLDRFSAAATDPNAINLDAWEVLYNAGRRDLRKTESTLKKLSDLLDDNNFNPTGGAWTKTDFENLFKKHGKLGRGSQVIDEDGVTQILSNATLSADELLDVLELARLKPKTGMADVLNKLCCSAGDKFYKGAEWQLRYARDIWDDILAFEAKIPPNVTENFREVDILLNTQPPKRLELKSWENFASNYEAGFIKQFGQDLADIGSLQDFKWIFDKRGMLGFANINHAYDHLRSKIVDVLKRKKDDLLLKVTPTKLNELFGSSDIDEIISMLEKDDDVFKGIFEIK